MSKTRKRFLLVGGGYVGLYTALRLQKRLRSELRSRRVEIIVVDPRSYMTYQPFLPEVAAGSKLWRVWMFRHMRSTVRRPTRPARGRTPGRSSLDGRSARRRPARPASAAGEPPARPAG